MPGEDLSLDESFQVPLYHSRVVVLLPDPLLGGDGAVYAGGGGGPIYKRTAPFIQARTLFEGEGWALCIATSFSYSLNGSDIYTGDDSIYGGGQRDVWRVVCSV